MGAWGVRSGWHIAASSYRLSKSSYGLSRAVAVRFVFCSLAFEPSQAVSSVLVDRFRPQNCRQPPTRPRKPIHPVFAVFISWWQAVLFVFSSFWGGTKPSVRVKRRVMPIAISMGGIVEGWQLRFGQAAGGLSVGRSPCGPHRSKSSRHLFACCGVVTYVRRSERVDAAQSNQRFVFGVCALMAKSRLMGFRTGCSTSDRPKEIRRLQDPAAWNATARSRQKTARVSS